MSSESKTPISAAVITFNEERNIGRCIDSLSGVADEIVVLDSGSTDRTRTICEEKGVRFSTRTFTDYADQKNAVAALAAHDMVLSLDADEALSENLRSALLTVKERPAADAYRFNRLTYYCGTPVRHSGWYPDAKVRLYNRQKARWTGRLIHERITVQEGGRTEHLNGDLLHYSFYTVGQHMDTVNNFSERKAQLMYEKGRGAPFWKMILTPPVKFLKIYLLKAGFLDGEAGFHIAVNSAHGDYLKYAKLRILRSQGRTEA